MKIDKFRDYFLGGLDAAEVEALELEVISSAESETELLLAEENLIEDYLEENLSPADKIKFEEDYLTSEPRRQQVEIIRHLKNRSPEASAPDAEPSFFEKLKAAFILRPVTALLTVCVLIAAIGFSWKLFFAGDQTNPQLAALNQKDLSNLADYNQLNKLSLNPGRLRSEGNSAGLPENNLTENVLLRLAFPVKLPSEKTFNVKILRNGESLSLLKQKSFQNQEVRLLLPKSLLTKGEYQITLEDGAENYNYFFTIQ